MVPRTPGGVRPRACGPPVRSRGRAIGAVVFIFIPGVGSMINGSAGAGLPSRRYSAFRPAGLTLSTSFHLHNPIATKRLRCASMGWENAGRRTPAMFKKKTEERSGWQSTFSASSAQPRGRWERAVAADGRRRSRASKQQAAARRAPGAGAAACRMPTNRTPARCQYGEATSWPSARQSSGYGIAWVTFS